MSNFHKLEFYSLNRENLAGDIDVVLVFDDSLTGKHDTYLVVDKQGFVTQYVFDETGGKQEINVNLHAVLLKLLENLEKQEEEFYGEEND